MFRDGIADFYSADTLRAYQHLFNMENYLRFIVKWQLVGVRGAKWQDALGHAGVTAREQMEKDAKLGLIDVQRENVMAYLMLSQVHQVIVSNDNWPAFVAKLGQKTFLDAQFQAVNRLRGKAMHCRSWTTDELLILEGALRLLARLTQSYRDEQTNAITVSNPAIGELPARIRNHVALIRAYGDAPSWVVRSYARVGEFDKLELALQGSGFEPDAAARIFRATQLDCFFLGASPETGRLDVYLSTKLSPPKVRTILQAIGETVPADGNDPAGGHRREERFDGLFGRDTPLPVKMNLPDMI